MWERNTPIAEIAKQWFHDCARNNMSRFQTRTLQSKATQRKLAQKYWICRQLPNNLFENTGLPVIKRCPCSVQDLYPRVEQEGTKSLAKNPKSRCPAQFPSDAKSCNGRCLWIWIHTCTMYVFTMSRYDVADQWSVAQRGSAGKHQLVAYESVSDHSRSARIRAAVNSNPFCSARGIQHLVSPGQVCGVFDSVRWPPKQITARVTIA